MGGLTIEGSLRGVHALEVLLEVFAREVGGQGDDFLDACRELSGMRIAQGSGWKSIRGSLVYSGQTSSSQAYRISSYINVAPGATWRKKPTLTGSPILTRWPFCTKICRVYLQRSLPSRLGTRYCSG